MAVKPKVCEGCSTLTKLVEAVLKQVEKLAAQNELLSKRFQTPESLFGTKPPPIEPAFLYTADEVAKHFRCGTTNVYRLAESGGLGMTRVGSGSKGLRFSGADILAFLDDRQEGGPAPLPSSYRHIGKFFAKG